MTAGEPATAATAKKKGSKGGRKGGTIFPRINLEKALAYADKLVSKTHTGPLPEATILAGVVENSGPTGQVRVSALKQFGLLEGDRKAYKATELARTINGAPPEERSPHIQKAFLNPKLFREISTTFQGDTVTKARIKQRALGLKVHPDFAEECVIIFVDSAVTAGLGKLDGDSVTLAKIGTIAPPLDDAGEGPSKTDVGDNTDAALADPQTDAQTDAQTDDGSEDGGDNGDDDQTQTRTRTNRGGVTVSLAVDSSSDPGKLERQLKLLKRFGLL